MDFVQITFPHSPQLFSDVEIQDLKVSLGGKRLFLMAKIALMKRWATVGLIIHLADHAANYHPKARDAEAAREQAARLEVIMMEQREASQPPVDAFLVEVLGQ